MDVRIEQATMGREVPPTTLAFGADEAIRVVVATEQRPTVLGLIASGRMRPTGGRVLVDGVATAADASTDRAESHAAARRLRASVALVDAPRASDPDPSVTLAGVVAEELLFAGVPGDPASVRGWATQLAAAADLATPIADVAPATRIRVLVELALLRDDVEAIVLVSPDRHGGDPHDWWRLARDVASRGFGVLVLCSAASDQVLRAGEGALAASAGRTVRTETVERAA